MSNWNEPLEIDFTSLFSYEDQSNSPELEIGEQGIIISADQIEYQDAKLSFHLLISYCFDKSFVKQFQNLKNAITVLVEDGAMGQACNFKLLDPHKRYPDTKGDNFKAKPNGQPSTKLSLVTHYAEIPLELEVINPGWGPSLSVRLVLQQHCSNTLVFDLSDEASMIRLQNGLPFTPKTQSEVEDE